jgi:hypothetical protein
MVKILPLSGARVVDFFEFSRLAGPRRASDHHSVIKAAAAAAPPEAARGLVATRTDVSGIGRARSGIPVGSVTAWNIVPVGRLGVTAVLLPVGAVAASTVAVAAAGAALALTEPAREVSLSSELDIWRSVERPLS